MERRDELLALLYAAGSILDLSGSSFSKRPTYFCRSSDEDAWNLLSDGALVKRDLCSAYKRTCVNHELPAKWVVPQDTPVASSRGMKQLSLPLTPVKLTTSRDLAPVATSKRVAG